MKLQELKNQLPNGAIREISRRMKISPATISNVLNEKTGSKKKPEIIKATAEYLKEYKSRENEASEAITEALNGI